MFWHLQWLLQSCSTVCEFLAVTITFILPMGFPYMNYLFPYPKIGSCHQVKMMIYVASVQMEEIFFFVISALGLFTKVLVFIIRMNYIRSRFSNYVIQTICHMETQDVQLDKQIVFTVLCCFIKLLIYLNRNTQTMICSVLFCGGFVIIIVVNGIGLWSWRPPSCNDCFFE